MPRKTNSSPPPEVMTWGKSAPVLTISIIFDSLRFMFTWFVFFGPALAALYCTVKVSDAVGSLGGIVAGACTAGAATAGYFGAPAIIVFGVIMAMITGLAGWLTVGLIILITNSRVLKESSLLFAGSLLVGVTPIINSLPALTGVTWRIYHTQIKMDKAKMEKWKKEQAASELQERQRQVAQAQSAQQSQLMHAQAMQQQAANDEEYEIPE